jgi:hypothetical protein
MTHREIKMNNPPMQRMARSDTNIPQSKASSARVDPAILAAVVKTSAI